MAYDPKDPADKKIVDDAVAAAVAEAAEQHEADVSGLKAKNLELRGKLAKAKTEGGDDSAAEVERLEGELAKTKTDLQKLQKDHTKATKDLETTAAERDGLNSNLSNLLIDQGLTSHLTEAKVDGKLLPAVKALLMPKVTLKTEGNERKAFVGDKSLGDFVKEWSQGDEGKIYTSAPANGGGGNHIPGGPQGGNAGKSITRNQYDAMAPAEASAFFAGGGTLTDA